MRAILGTAIIFLIVFFIVAMVVNDSVPRQNAIASMEFALQWTFRLLGAITAVISAVGLLYHFTLLSGLMSFDGSV